MSNLIPSVSLTQQQDILLKVKILITVNLIKTLVNENTYTQDCSTHILIHVVTWESLS